MGFKNKLNGNGRKTFSFSLKPSIMKDFADLCDSMGFALSKRLEIALLHDMEKIKHLKEIHNYSSEATAKEDDTSGSAECIPEKISENRGSMKS